MTTVSPPDGAWAGVQWGDPTDTTWTNIDRWFGPLQQTSEGRMALWMEANLMGTGPYRWVIYDKDPSQGGKLWGVSDPFNFPAQKGDWVWTRAMK